MTNLIVCERDGLLVVDHRLISGELGIQPKNVLANIDNHLTTPESVAAFGRVAFETETLKTKGGMQETRVAYLNQPQAEFLMTLSRNTPQVIAAKRNLVSAFEKAKQLIKQVIPAQFNRIRELELELELARAQDSAARSQERLMQTTQAIATLHGSGMVALILGKPEAVVERVTEVEKTVVVNQSGKPIATYKGLSKTKLAKRYGLKKAADLVNWLESIGKADLLQPGITAAPCQYIPFESVPELDRLWAACQGSRQRLLGE